MNLVYSEENLERVREIFTKNNSISSGNDENYVIDFNNKLNQFFSQELLKSEDHIRNILLNMLSKYKYFTRAEIDHVLKDFYSDISSKTDKKYTIYSSIPSEKDKSRSNSSHFYLQKFFDVNNLSSDLGIQIQNLISSSNEIYLKKVLSHKDLKNINPNSLAYAKKKLTHMETVILIDDFSGTGETISSFLKEALELIKDKTVLIYLIATTKTAKLKLQEDSRNLGYSKIFINSYFELDCFFNTYNEYLSEKEKLIIFERDSIKSSRILGYNQTGCLLSFYRNTPNNTISSFWWNENEKWQSLFPRSNNSLDTFGKMKDDELLQNIKYNLKILNPSTLLTDDEIKVSLVLLYLRDVKGLKEDFEICKLIGYNKNQLKHLFVDLIDKKFISSNYSILHAGSIFLNSFNLDTTNLFCLTEPKTLKSSDDALEIDAIYVPAKFKI